MIRSLTLSVSLLAFSGLLTGCASLSGNLSNPLDRFRPEATLIPADASAAPPQAWTQPAPLRTPTTDWVSYFDAPGLTQAVDEALGANTNVRAAAASWRAARASAIAANSDLLPSVDFSGRASHSEFANSNIGDSNSLNLGLGASWEADLWGRIIDTAKAAALSAQSSRADYAAARLSVAGSTAQAWLDLTEARLQLDLANRNLQTQDRALTLTQRRFESGITSSTDVRLARSSVASAQAGVASRRQTQASAARSLEILLRRYPAAAFEGRADLPALPPLEGAGQPEDIFRRPDLIASERDLAAQGLQVDIARKNLLPRLTLSADADSSGSLIQDLFDIDSLVASLAAGLTVPIFNAGALDAEVDRREAVLEQLVERYVGDILNAYLEVENALDAEQRLFERETALRVSLFEAQEAEKRLATRYSSGLATILELLDAQSRAISAEQQLISARKERLANRVRLHLALGGGQFSAQPTALAATNSQGGISPL